MSSQVELDGAFLWMTLIGTRMWRGGKAEAEDSSFKGISATFYFWETTGPSVGGFSDDFTSINQHRKNAQMMPYHYLRHEEHYLQEGLLGPNSLST